MKMVPTKRPKGIFRKIFDRMPGIEKRRDKEIKKETAKM
jgi:hypothetical protein